MRVVLGFEHDAERRSLEENTGDNAAMMPVEDVKVTSESVVATGNSGQEDQALLESDPLQDGANVADLAVGEQFSNPDDVPQRSLASGLNTVPVEPGVSGTARGGSKEDVAGGSGLGQILLDQQAVKPASFSSVPEDRSSSGGFRRAGLGCSCGRCYPSRVC